MKITKKQLKRIVESLGDYDWTELSGRSVSGMGAEVADRIMDRYPQWLNLDEHPLERLVDEEIGYLRPGPLDDDWIDVLEAAMAVLLDQGSRY